MAFSISMLRALVVLPGAAVEGALMVALPWMVTRAAQGTPWLGIASAGIVGAGLLGTLLAPFLERRLGNRLMTVATGFACGAALVVAGWSWIMDEMLLAYAMALVSIVADATCDVGFTARLPVLARLARQRLERLSAGNWLWSIGGAALGSVFAGWALDAQQRVLLVTVLCAATLLVAVALALLLPRQAQYVRTEPPMRALWSAQFWSPSAVRIALVLAALVFFAGPLDNLLMPLHLTTHGQPAEVYGHVIASAGLGIAVGLSLLQSDRITRHRRVAVVAGLLGLAVQLTTLMLLPPQWLLLVGTFVGAVLFAPLLPMLEATMLSVARPTQRTLMLAALSALAALADISGTISLGVVAAHEGSAGALAVCISVAVVAVVAAAVAAVRSKG